MGERSLCSLCWQPTIKACELADQKQLSSQAAENANDDSQPWRHLEKHARALPAAQWSQLQAVYVTVSMWCSLMLQCQQLQMQTHRNAQAPLQTAAWACFVQHVKHTHMQTFRDTRCKSCTACRQTHKFAAFWLCLNTVMLGMEAHSSDRTQCA